LKLHYGANEQQDDDEVDSEIQMFQNALEFSGWRPGIMSPEPSYSHWFIWLYSRTERIIHETGYSKVGISKFIGWYCVMCIRLICLRSPKV
jgi:hypothetical protein